jgi:DNA-binding MarR family transcriptional regulator
LVKQLDERNSAELIDHFGWQLWRLSRQWKAEFDAAITAAGHGWMTQAQGAVVGQLRQAGVPQAELARVLGITKQAVQQLVDVLVADGLVRRVVDPADKRGRIVELTPSGAKALEEGNRIKRQIEERYSARLGTDRFAALTAMLEELTEPTDK